jgi:hypothetical protein
VLVAMATRVQVAPVERVATVRWRLAMAVPEARPLMSNL